MADDKKPAPISTFTGEFTIDVSKPFGLTGGWPDSGVYTAVIKELGVSTSGKNPSIALTLSGVGDRVTYDYLTIPHGEKAESHVNLFTRLFIAAGLVNEGGTGTIAIRTNELNALVGRPVTIYYIQPPPNDEGAPDTKLGSQEITYLMPSEIEKVRSGEVKITRRQKPKVVADPLAIAGNGAASAASALPAGGGLAFGGGAAAFGGGASSGAAVQPGAVAQPFGGGGTAFGGTGGAAAAIATPNLNAFG